MSANFIDDLIEAVQQVVRTDMDYLKEVIIISGMPEITQNHRYLGYNRHQLNEGASRMAFSATALINNRRADKWLLKGYAKKMSRLLFNPRWTRSELDMFINALRCSPDVIAVLTAAEAPYSLLGILEIEDPGSSGIFKRWQRRIRPILAIPGLDNQGVDTISAFEEANEIRRSGRI